MVWLRYGLNPIELSILGDSGGAVQILHSCYNVVV